MHGKKKSHISRKVAFRRPSFLVPSKEETMCENFIFYFYIP